MKVLFVCTHNRCRSILAEAITNHLSDGGIIARSAGSQPSGEVHPLTLRYLEEKGVSTEGLKSQSWDELQSFSPDIVFTVCDSAAKEVCPVWFGDCIKINWALPDPSRVEGTEHQIRESFFNVIDEITRRVTAFSELDYSNMEVDELSQSLNAIPHTRNMINQDESMHG